VSPRLKMISSARQEGRWSHTWSHVASRGSRPSGNVSTRRLEHPHRPAPGNSIAAWLWGSPHSISRFPVRTTGDLRAASPQERAEALKARAAMIERSSYVFPERITARLGPAASPETIALVQHSTTTQSLCAFAELAT
jgi:hypothetical protein